MLSTEHQGASCGSRCMSQNYSLHDKFSRGRGALSLSTCLRAPKGMEGIHSWHALPEDSASATNKQSQRSRSRSHHIQTGALGPKPRSYWRLRESPGQTLLRGLKASMAWYTWLPDMRPGDPQSHICLSQALCSTLSA